MQAPFAAPYFQLRKHFLSAHTADIQEAALPSGTFSPGLAPKIYQFPSKLTTPPKSITKYGIISLGGNVSNSDIAAFCKAGGYPLPKVMVLAVNGVTVTSDPHGANVENQLDIQRIIEGWNEAFPSVPADITVAIGPNVGTGIAQVAQALDNAGCTDLNCSWGAPESQWAASDIATTEATCAAIEAKGKTVSVASGDNSANDGTRKATVDCPCNLAHVWAVGGTQATVVNGVLVSEKAWGDGRAGDAGGGGGFSAVTPILAWQNGIVPGTRRGCPDSSANASPETGYQTYADGAWGVVGGTSASAPLTCSLFGAIRAMGGDLHNYQSKLYAARASCWHDILLGSNGLPAMPGWDAATGLGTINAPGIVQALLGTVLPPPPPIPTTIQIVLNHDLAVGTYSLTRML